jgi:hypothetical protein
MLNATNMELRSDPQLYKLRNEIYIMAKQHITMKQQKGRKVISVATNNA